MLILEWVNHADLWRINGVGSEYSDLLEAAGVDSPAELAQRNAANLAPDLPGPGCGAPELDPPDPVRGDDQRAGSSRRRACPRSSSTSRAGARSEEESAMISEFKGFLLKTNALALAIGVIIGGALGTVVNSLVNDIIMPPIGMALGGVDFSQLKVVLKDAAGGDPATEVAIRYGAFLNSIIAFVVIAFVVWQISQDVHQGAATGRGQDLPVLQGGERRRRDQVPGLRQRDLTTRPVTPPGLFG